MPKFFKEETNGFSDKDYKLEDKDYKLEVLSHNSFNSKILWDVKEPTHLSKRVGNEVPGVVASLFSKVAVSKYTCKRLRVYEATKRCVNSP